MPPTPPQGKPAIPVTEVRNPELPPAPAPPPSAPGVTVFFYPNGTYFTSDVAKNNLPEACGDWYVAVIKDLLGRGLVDDNTVVYLPAVFTGPIGFLRQQKGF